MSAKQVQQELPREVMMELRGVHKWFGDLHVLKGINLKVLKGERIIICGPSGCGKSTLIRCMHRLEGEILINGIPLDEDFRHIEKVHRNVGVVFQPFNLFPHLSVLENCSLALIWVLKQPRKEAEARALRYLERVGAADQATKYSEQLSGGQQQRVAIARSLCMQPSIMLFDEPTSVLDPEMIKEVLDVMIDLAQEGMTMLCVTHEMGFSRTVADRILFMDSGEILEENEPTAFFETPQSERTKLFLSQIL